MRLLISKTKRRQSVFTKPLTWFRFLAVRVEFLFYSLLVPGNVLDSFTILRTPKHFAVVFHVKGNINTRFALALVFNF